MAWAFATVRADGLGIEIRTSPRRVSRIIGPDDPLDWWTGFGWERGVVWCLDGYWALQPRDLGREPLWLPPPPAGLLVRWPVR
jgi:hypothetical protein